MLAAAGAAAVLPTGAAPTARPTELPEQTGSDQKTRTQQARPLSPPDVNFLQKLEAAEKRDDDLKQSGGCASASAWERGMLGSSILTVRVLRIPAPRPRPLATQGPTQRSKDCTQHTNDNKSCRRRCRHHHRYYRDCHCSRRSCCHHCCHCCSCFGKAQCYGRPARRQA
jgi:hypothetical protein